MELNALCEEESCQHLFIINLDRLIEEVGAEYKLDDIPQLACPKCGRPLLIRLSFADHPPEGDED